MNPFAIGRPERRGGEYYWKLHWDDDNELGDDGDWWELVIRPEDD